MLYIGACCPWLSQAEIGTGQMDSTQDFFRLLRNLLGDGEGCFIIADSQTKVAQTFINITQNTLTL
jgi:hypothetical protein